MDKNGIDDLLKIVSPGLIAGYEAKNLDGKSLKEVSDNFRGTDAKGKRVAMKQVWSLFLTAIFCGLFVALMVYLGSSNDLTIICVMLAGFLSFILIQSGPLERTIDGYRKDMDHYERILQDFQWAVEALDPHGTMTNRDYTEESTHNTLVVSAVRLLDAEMRFKEKRMQEKEPTWSVLDAGNWEVQCRKEFEKLLKDVENFGLTFNKAELFREAQKTMTK